MTEPSGEMAAFTIIMKDGVTLEAMRSERRMVTDLVASWYRARQRPENHSIQVGSILHETAVGTVWFPRDLSIDLSQIVAILVK